MSRNSRVTIESLEGRRLLARVAVIGDLADNSGLRDVSNMIKSWSPAAIVTAGDNTHDEDYIDQTVGKYFHDYVSPYRGSYGSGSTSGNKFWPTIGNHDYDRPVSEYTNYFSLPNNERYYTVPAQGNLQFFVVNSNTQEPNGTSSTSTQANWLKSELAASSATWKIVMFHHPAYTSGTERNHTRMQWPFQQWGASAVISGHDHMYERLLKNNFPYFVNGLGGASIVPPDRVESGSQVRYSGNFGAMLIDAQTSSLNFKFITRDGTVRDSYTITKTSTPTNTTTSNLISAGSTWKYLDNGSDAGTSWRSSTFDDTAWKSGSAELGYGDGDERTVISYGTNASNKHVTTYFRRRFNVTNPASISSLTVNVKRDDGAVIYLNGTEIMRTNMPTGTIGFRTYASSAIEDGAYKSAGVNRSLLRSGENALTVEVHQADATSSDVSFDLSLVAQMTTATASAAAYPAASSYLRRSDAFADSSDTSVLTTSTARTGTMLVATRDAMSDMQRKRESAIALIS